MAQANVKLTVDATSATRALRGVQSQSTKLQNTFGGLKTAIAGIGFTLLAKQAVTTAANFNKLNIRLKLLTKETGTFAQSQAIAAEAQRAFGLSATEALEGITNITARLAPLGVAVEDIKSTFFGFNTAAKLAGASTIEASNAFRQLAQALGSGRLQGDEFRSLAEQIPTLLQPIAKELGVTIGELKKFASEGKLTSDVVLRALKKIETEGASSLEALVKADPTQVFKDLSNATEDLSRAIGDRLNVVVLPAIRLLTDLTLSITDFLNSGAGQITVLFAGIAAAIKAVTFVTPLLIGQLAGVATSFQITAANSFLASTGLKGVAAASFIAAGGITKTTIALQALKIALIKTGLGAVIVILGTLAARFIDNKNAAKEAADAAKAFNEQLGITTEEGGEVAKIIDEITQKQKELNKARIRPASKQRIRDEIKELEALKLILEGEKKRNKELARNKKFNDMTIKSLKAQDILEQKINGKTNEQITLEQKILDIKKEFEPEDAKALIALIKQEEKLKEKLDLMEKNKKKAEELKEKFAAIGEEIEGSIKNNLRDAITGAQSFGQAMTNVLNKIRDKIIDAQIDKMMSGFSSNFKKDGSGKGIGGFLGKVIGGFFANGGRPPVGKASVVGERGPELFVPKVAGTIVPTNKLGGGDNTTNIVNVSVDASGSSVAGNSPDAQQLGAIIGAAVQAQLIKEKRSGGLLAR